MAKTQVDDINRSIYNIKNDDNFSYKMKKGLDEGIVREISKMKNEPEWMLKCRLHGLEMFNKLEMPTWGPDLSCLNMDEISTYVKPKAGLSDSWVQTGMMYQKK